MIFQQIGADSSIGSSSTIRDTGTTLPLNSVLVPPKSVIQDDIRMKLGRFELVKKKGRSEVWNLFGQVRFVLNSFCELFLNNFLFTS